MCKDCDKRNGTNFFSKEEMTDQQPAEPTEPDPHSDVVQLSNEQQEQKDLAENTVSPNSNATFTQMTPAPQAPMPGDVTV